MKHLFTLMIAALITMSSATAQNVGQVAPDFTLKTLENSDYVLSGNRGKVILAFMVGYGCPLCIASSPDVKAELQNMFGSNSKFQFLVIDTWDGSTTALNGFKNNTGLDAIYLQKGGSVATSWSTTYDRLIVIDAQGKMVFKGGKAARSDVNSAKTAIETALKNLTTSAIDIEKNKQASLGQNFPNPVINKANIEFSIAKAGEVSLKVIDITGKEVATLIHEKLDAGLHSAEFKTDNIPNGIYFYRLDVESFSVSKKMIVNK
jgi:hypothetical protein